MIQRSQPALILLPNLSVATFESFVLLAMDHLLTDLVLLEELILVGPKERNREAIMMKIHRVMVLPS